MDLFWEQTEPSAGRERRASTQDGQETLRKGAAFFSRLWAVLPWEVPCVLRPKQWACHGCGEGGQLEGQPCVLMVIGDGFTGLAVFLHGEDLPFYTKIDVPFPSS